MKTESVGSFPVSVHVSVKFPGADTFVPAEVAADVLRSVFGQHDGFRSYQMFSAGIVDPVGSSQMRFKVTGQLRIGGERFLAEFTLKFFHVNKFDVVSEGFCHDETVWTLSKLRTGTVTSLIMNREFCRSFKQLEASLTLDGVTGYISNVFRVLILLAHVVCFRGGLFVNSLTVVFEQLYRGERHPTVPAVESGAQQTKG